MPFRIHRFLHLLLSIAAMVSRFKMHWVPHRADLNGVYPLSTACKMAKLFIFSEERSQHGCTIIE